VTRIAAVILAGGRAERLGGINKAMIEIGGQRLIDRALAAVHGCDPIMLSVGHVDFSIPGTIAVADLATPYAGPLAGVAAAIDYLTADAPDLLLSLAVDTPYFPADYVQRALFSLGQGGAMLAAYDGQDYPTNALWRFDAVRDLPGQVRSGISPHSLKRLAACVGAASLDYAAFTAEDPFGNANTPEDLEILRARAAGNQAG
jgi:molybdopterin-guanine dinucleotide biosynthesis protein A